MSRVGRYARARARPGHRDSLVALLLAVARVLEGAPGCELYVINTSPADPDTVWVTEIWSSQADLDASLALDGVPELVEHVVPLMAAPPERIEVLPLGGKGLAAG